MVNPASRRRAAGSDITRSRWSRWLQPKLSWLWLSFFVIVLFVLFVLGDRNMAVFPTLLFIVGLGILFLAGSVAWTLVVRRGVLTWRRLARAPARAMARGDTVEAERALGIALARVRRFGAQDYRRGLMLLELAGHVKNQGRYSDAEAHYEECVEILAQHRRSCPIDYFIALNNYAIYFIHIRDYEAAQRFLERALDLTLIRRKDQKNQTDVMGRIVLGIELILNLNLVFLFVEMHELAEAKDRLEEADAVFLDASRKQQAAYGNHYHAIRALVFYSLGQFANAGSELDRAPTVNYPACLRVRAMLCLVRRDFAEAEALGRRYLDLERKKGTLHRPELRNHLLDLAESLYGQGKLDDAFHTVEEARSITADYALPANRAWRRVLETWRQRAHELKRPDAVASFDAELHALAVKPEQGIMVSDRLRVHPITGAGR
jgi:tetratricopeptide (TPR) repeat protein